MVGTGPEAVGWFAAVVVDTVVDRAVVAWLLFAEDIEAAAAAAAAAVGTAAVDTVGAASAVGMVAVDVVASAASASAAAVSSSAAFAPSSSWPPDSVDSEAVQELAEAQGWGLLLEQPRRDLCNQ